MSEYRGRLSEVPGWFGLQDFWIFDFVLGAQSDQPAGDLLEMGPYLGRSAILLGLHRRRGEQVTVCDLFGDAPPDAANARENDGYPNLVRTGFEQHYADFTGELPRIIQAPTATLAHALPPRSQRFVHVDAAHSYDRVAEDIDTACRLLRPGGVVACDDFRSVHTPGTAAAVWQAVLDGRLEVVCLSAQKLYAAAPGEAQAWHGRLRQELARTREMLIEPQTVAGQDVLRLLMPFSPIVAASVDRLERRLLPGWLKVRLDRRRLATWMLGWAKEQPMIAAEVAARTGIDLVNGPAPNRGATEFGGP